LTIQAKNRILVYRKEIVHPYLNKRKDGSRGCSLKERASFTSNQQLVVQMEANIMSLRYRGAEYEPNSANFEFTEEVIGHYRGAVVTRRVAKNAPHQHVDGLTYRGAKVR